MSDSLNRIALTMCPIVHRIDAPRVAGAVMCRAENAIHDRIAHVEVRRCHIDPCAQRLCTIRKFSVAHALEEVQILFNTSVSARTVFARLSQRTSVFSHLIGVEIANIRLSFLDQLNGVFVELLKVIGRVVEPVPPIKTKPTNVALN
jgi:hypothetical protein